MQLENDLFTVTDEAGLLFTKKGREELTDYFRYAGIEINTIRTYEEYLSARECAAPYFMDWMKTKTSGLPNNGEIDLIRSALFDTPDEHLKKMDKFKRRKLLKLVR